MPRKQSGYTYTVSGSGPFPFDMLRYDRSWPHHSEDATRVEPYRQSHEHRSVNLMSHNTPEPTVGRWVSFGWTVSNVKPIFN